MMKMIKQNFSFLCFRASVAINHKKLSLLCLRASVATSHLRKQIMFSFFLVAFQSAAFAQTPRTYTSSEILLQIKKLNVRIQIFAPLNHQ